MSAVYIAAIARRLPPWAAQAEREYAKRLADLPLIIRVVKPSAAADAGKARAAEARALSAKIPKNAEIILLDAEGESHTSATFARILADARRRGATLAFVIGGADGVAGAVKAAAVSGVSLSPLTFPHALARVVLLEQLYRAAAILKGHPYPR